MLGTGKALETEPMHRMERLRGTVDMSSISTQRASRIATEIVARPVKCALSMSLLDHDCYRASAVRNTAVSRITFVCYRVSYVV
jgi:hypothetical protein